MNQSFCTQFSALQKEQDKLYREAARSLGISDTNFLILFFFRDEPAPLTQSQLVELTGLPAQTVNSALKKMEAEGYLTMTPGQDKRKKLLSLTPSGELLAQSTVDRVTSLEKAAVESLSEEDQQIFLALFRRHCQNLKQQFNTLRNTP